MGAARFGHRLVSGNPMKIVVLLLAWLLLLALSWPMVLDYILVASLLWVITLPLRLAWRARDLRR